VEDEDEVVGNGWVGWCMVFISVQLADSLAGKPLFYSQMMRFSFSLLCCGCYSSFFFSSRAFCVAPVFIFSILWGCVLWINVWVSGWYCLLLYFMEGSFASDDGDERFSFYIARTPYFALFLTLVGDVMEGVRGGGLGSFILRLGFYLLLGGEKGGEDEKGGEGEQKRR
jgi:hypothetical protein